MFSNRKKLKQINDIVASGYIGTLTAVATFAVEIIEKGGKWTLFLLPITDYINAYLYWAKTQDPNFKDKNNPTKVWRKHSYHASQIMATAVGVGFILSGALTLGFTIMIASGYLSAARSLYNAASSYFSGRKESASKHLGKSLFAGLISTGFLFMTFFPPFSLLGSILVFIAAGHGLLSTFPPAVMGLPMPEIVNPPPLKYLDTEKSTSLINNDNQESQKAVEGLKKPLPNVNSGI